MAVDLKTVRYDYTVKRYPVKKKVTRTWWGHKKHNIEVMYDSVTTVGAYGNELTLPDYTNLATASRETLEKEIRLKVARILGVSPYYLSVFVDNILNLDKDTLRYFSGDYIYTNLEIDIHFPNIGVEDFPDKTELEANALTLIHKVGEFERGMAFTYLYKKLEEAKEHQAYKLVLSTGRPWYKLHNDNWSEDQVARETQATRYFLTHQSVLEELGFKLKVSKITDYYSNDPSHVLEILWVDLDETNLPDFDKLPYYKEGRQWNM